MEESRPADQNLADFSASALTDSLYADFAAGRPLAADLVWELARRAIAAEELHTRER
jgi:hypothetical protein